MGLLGGLLVSWSLSQVASQRFSILSFCSSCSCSFWGRYYCLPPGWGKSEDGCPDSFFLDRIVFGLGSLLSPQSSDRPVDYRSSL